VPKATPGRERNREGETPLAGQGMPTECGEVVYGGAITLSSPTKKKHQRKKKEKHCFEGITSDLKTRDKKKYLETNPFPILDPLLSAVRISCWGVLWSAG